MRRRLLVSWFQASSPTRVRYMVFDEVFSARSCLFIMPLFSLRVNSCRRFRFGGPFSRAQLIFFRLNAAPFGSDSVVRYETAPSSTSMFLGSQWATGANIPSRVDIMIMLCQLSTISRSVFPYSQLLYAVCRHLRLLLLLSPILVASPSFPGISNV